MHVIRGNKRICVRGEILIKAPFCLCRAMGISDNILGSVFGLSHYESLSSINIFAHPFPSFAFHFLFHL